MWLRVLLVTLVVGGVVFAIRFALNARSVFAIRVHGKRVEVSGLVPGHSVADVGDFIASLKLPAGARIRAVPDGERFRLEFSPQVPAGERQRIRNFLYLHV